MPVPYQRRRLPESGLGETTLHTEGGISSKTAPPEGPEDRRRDADANIIFQARPLGTFGKINVKTHNFPPHKVRLKTKGDSDVYVIRNTFDPGGSSGWHTHPGPSLITVTKGEITAYEGDDPKCRPKVYREGEGFVDPGDGHVHVLRNETTAPAETVAVQILPRGAARRIDAPDPGNCPF